MTAPENPYVAGGGGESAAGSARSATPPRRDGRDAAAGARRVSLAPGRMNGYCKPFWVRFTRQVEVSPVGALLQPPPGAPRVVKYTLEA